MDAKAFVAQTIHDNPVVLFMKGTAQSPQCGFSSRAIQLLKSCGVTQVATVNVLEDDTLREGIKAFSDWPTIPQLYVKGEFVGGCDIVREMYETGELTEMFQTRGVDAKPSA